MSPSPQRRPEPQKTLLYRLVAFFSRRQFAFFVRRGRHSRLQVALFVFGAGAIALGILSAVARMTQLPLVFPPLAASTFILFNMPLSESASPRVVLPAHVSAVLLGLLARWLVVTIGPGDGFGAPDSVTWGKVAAIALAMGMVGVTMIVGRCVHPPAAATAMIAAMGYIGSVAQVLGFVAAVVLLLLEAFLLNRLVGGLPYPLWRWRPEKVVDYRALAGYEESRPSFWKRARRRADERRQDLIPKE